MVYTVSNELLLVTESNCSCTIVYQCTVTGKGSTVWQGSAFHCDDTEGSLTLRHSQFASGMYEEECNGGEVVARAIGVNESIFTSQFSLTVSPEMNNKTVECAYDNGTTVSVIDTATVTVVFAEGINTTACTHVLIAN